MGINLWRKPSSFPNLISVALLAFSHVVWYFFSIIGGALIALAAEIVALIPNTKLTRMMKRNGLGSAQKLEAKAIKKELKKKNRAYAVSFIIASIAMVLVIFYIASIEFLSTLN